MGNSLWSLTHSLTGWLPVAGTLCRLDINNVCLWSSPIAKIESAMNGLSVNGNRTERIITQKQTDSLRCAISVLIWTHEAILGISING